MLKIVTNFYTYFWILTSLILLFYYYKRKELIFLWLKRLIIFWPIITFAQLVTTNLVIYFSWRNNRFLRHLLPPESNYLFESIKNYDFSSYFATLIISFFIGATLLIVAKKSQEKFLKYSEVDLIFLGCLIVSWSNIIVFIFSSFIFNFLAYLVLLATRKIKSSDIIFVAPYVLLAIIFTLLIGYKLSYLTGLY